MASSLFAGLSVKCPDLVIATSPPLFVGLPAYVISVIRRCPLVFEVRDIWPQSAIELGILKSRMLIKLSTWFEKFIYSRSALIVVLLEKFKEHVASCGICEDKVVYVPNGADLDLFADPRPRPEVRRELGFSQEFLVLYMGAHGVSNDLEQVLRAARLLKEDGRIRFIFLGDGMDKPRLRELARKWGLSNVRFLDSVPKDTVKDICNSVDVGLLVGKNLALFKASLPNKLFDYMAAGKPIITTVDGVARHLIDSAGAGLYADPEKPEEMVECILKLRRDPTTCAEMGRSGRAFVEAHFRRERLSSFYEGCLVELVRQRGLLRSPRSATPQA
jgi:glycosyltransferase involved in cell wall biosynthesis